MKFLGLFIGYLKIYDIKGNLLSPAQVVNSSGCCDVHLGNFIKEYGLSNLVIEVNKKGLKKLFNSYIIFRDGAYELGRKHITATDIVNAPLILKNINQYCHKNVEIHSDASVLQEFKEYVENMPLDGE